jgi:hypothetical protein
MAEELGILVAKLQADVADLKKGLQDGRRDLSDFKSHAESVGQLVKKALTFAGLTLGIGVILKEIKDLAQGAVEAGSKIEQLKLATYATGQNFGYTAGVIDLLAAKLKETKLGTEEAYASIGSFIRAGLDPQQLVSLAVASKDLAVSARKSFQDVFMGMVESIATAQPRALREVGIQAKEFMELIMDTQKNLEENLKLTTQERSQAMLDLVLKYAQTVKGVSESAAGTHAKQLSELKRTITEVKEVLWDFMEPLTKAITGEKIKAWSDLLRWLTANREELQRWGATIGTFIRMVWQVVSAVIGWVVANGDLVKTLIELGVAYKLAGYIIALATAMRAAVPAIYALATGATVAWAAFGGWLGIILQVGIALAALAAYKIGQMVKEQPSVGAMMLMGEAGGFYNWEKDEAGLRKADEEAAKKKGAEKKPAGPYDFERLAQMTPEERQAEIDRQVQGAMYKWRTQFGKTPGEGKGGKEGKAGPEEDVFGEYLKMLEAKRQAELQDATSSFEILKAGNEKKKAEMEKALEEGLLDGRAYHEQLMAMEQQEFQAALALIEKKKQAQLKARQDALADLARQDLSPEVMDYRRQAIEAAHRVQMIQLAGEAAKTVQEHEKKVTEEVTRQLKTRKEISDTLKTQEEGAAFGPLQEKEARINALLREQLRLREELVKKGATPEELGRFDATTQKKLEIARFGEDAQRWAQAISQGLSSLIDSLMEGGQDLKKALNSFFKSLFKEALVPGMKALVQWLGDLFKDFFGSVGQSLGSAILGMVALVGMLLTSGGSSSWSPSGVQSGVTSHEAVRGVIAGETSIPIAEIGESLQDALIPTNGILSRIEENTRNLKGLQLNINIEGLQETLREALDRYFQDMLQLGVPA